MKKSTLLEKATSIFLAVSLSFGQVAYAAAETDAGAGFEVGAGGTTTTRVEINVDNFPDSAFLAYVQKEFDKNDDNVLSAEEIADANSVNISNTSITSIKGIEHLSALRTFTAENSQVKDMDLSNNKELDTFNCRGSYSVETINLSGTKVKNIYAHVSNDSVKSIDLRNCPNLGTGNTCYIPGRGETVYVSPRATSFQPTAAGSGTVSYNYTIYVELTESDFAKTVDNDKTVSMSDILSPALLEAFETATDINYNKETKELVIPAKESTTTIEAKNARDDYSGHTTFVFTTPKYDQYYTVDFVTNGGSAVKSQHVADGGTVYKGAVISEKRNAKGSQLIDTWYTDEALTQEFDFNTPVTHPITLYAKWCYQVILQGENQTSIIDTIDIKYVQENTALAKPEDPVKDGKYFTGWYADNNLTSKYDFSQLVTDNMILYARFVSGVPIDAKHFPDDVFRNYLLTTVDKLLDGQCDGILTPDEASGVEELSFEGTALRDLTGIEYLPNLKKLDVSNTPLEKLDLSKNAKLESLTCKNMAKLGSIDVRAAGDFNALDCSGSTSIRSIDVSGTKVSDINLVDCTGIDDLYARNCPNLSTGLKLLRDNNINNPCGISSIHISAGMTGLRFGYWPKMPTIFISVSSDFYTLADDNSKIIDMTDLLGSWYIDILQESSDYDAAQKILCVPATNSGLALTTLVGSIWVETPKLKNRYEVTFETNGGTSVECQLREDGDTAEQPTKPTKDSYTFMGWYADKDLTQKYDFATPVTGNMTLYAKWGVQVDFNTGGLKNIDSQLLEIGSTVAQPDDIEIENYYFIGWFKDAGYTQRFDFSETLQTNTTVYAKLVQGYLPNATNFPNENFRSYLSVACDKDSDGVLSLDEINAFTCMSICTQAFSESSLCESTYHHDFTVVEDIKDFTGIEKLVGLSTIEIAGMSAPSLDLSANVKLQRVYLADFPSITSFDFSKFPSLKTVFFHGDVPITEIDLSGNTTVQDFWVSDLTELKTIDLSGSSVSSAYETGNMASLEKFDLRDCNELSWGIVVGGKAGEKVYISPSLKNIARGFHVGSDTEETEALNYEVVLDLDPTMYYINEGKDVNYKQFAPEDVMPTSMAKILKENGGRNYDSYRNLIKIPQGKTSYTVAGDGIHSNEKFTFNVPEDSTGGRVELKIYPRYGTMDRDGTQHYDDYLTFVTGYGEKIDFDALIANTPDLQGYTEYGGKKSPYAIISWGCMYLNGYQCSYTTFDKDAIITGSTSLDAIWGTYVNFHAPSDDDLYDTKAVRRGSTTPKPADPERTGYEFDGWYKGDGNPYDFGAANNFKCAQVDVYAHWKEGVYLNETRFPDQYLREYLSKNFDKDSDGFLSAEELKAVTAITLDGISIDKTAGTAQDSTGYVEDLTGIEYLTSLESVTIVNNVKIQNIDLTKSCAKTVTINNCSQGPNVDVSGSSVETLSVGGEGKTPVNIDVQGCTKLVSLTTPGKGEYVLVSPGMMNLTVAQMKETGNSQIVIDFGSDYYELDSNGDKVYKLSELMAPKLLEILGTATDTEAGKQYDATTRQLTVPHAQKQTQIDASHYSFFFKGIAWESAEKHIVDFVSDNATVQMGGETITSVSVLDGNALSFNVVADEDYGIDSVVFNDGKTDTELSPVGDGTAGSGAGAGTDAAGVSASKGFAEGSYTTPVVTGNSKVTIATHKHEWDDGAVKTQPTCTTDGLIEYSCKVDGCIATMEEFVAGEHKLVAIEEVPATCSTTGTEAYWKCTACNQLFESSSDGSLKEITEPKSIPATGHSLEAVAEVPATCTAIGAQAYWKCTTCAKLFSDADGTTEISAPLIIKPAGHSLEAVAEVPATCITAGSVAHWKCTVCEGLFKDAQGATKIDAPQIIPAKGHAISAVAEVPASCTTNGTKAYWTCNTCKKMFSDAAGTTEIKEPVVTPALQHNYVYKDNKDGMHSAYCSRCNAIQEGSTEKHEYNDKGYCNKCKAAQPTYTVTFECSTATVQIDNAPVSLAVVAENGTVSFTVTPAKGYTIKEVALSTGKAGEEAQTLDAVDGVYTTPTITQNCTIIVTTNDPLIQVASIDVCSDEAFAYVKNPDGQSDGAEQGSHNATGLYLVTANVSKLASGYVPCVEGTKFVYYGVSDEAAGVGSVTYVYKTLVSYDVAQALDAGSVDIEAVEGQAEISSALKGDVNRNGRLNIVDAQVAYDIACARYTANALSPASFLAADVNNNNCVDASDAFAIQHAIHYGWE